MHTSHTQQILSVAGVPISVLSGSSTFFFKAAMAIDADGAPNAYHPIPGRGLDHLANAGHPGNWYVVVTDTGHRNCKPVVQGPRDPAPGFYVSPTVLQDRPHARTDPRRYVDSASIPYISLPGHHGTILRAALGDIAMVTNGHNGAPLAPQSMRTPGPRPKLVKAQ